MNRSLVRRLLLPAAILAMGVIVPPAQAGPVVRFTFNYSVTTDSGPLDYVDIALDPADAPITVANFLQYVNNGLYDNTIIHRQASIAGTTSMPTPTSFKAAATSLRSPRGR